MIRQLYHTFMGLFQRPDPDGAEAFGRALEAFQAKYPQRQVHESWYSVEKEEASSYIQIPLWR